MEVCYSEANSPRNREPGMADSPYQQGSRRSLEQLREEAHQLGMYAQWRLGQAIDIYHEGYVRSAEGRVIRIKKLIDDRLR